MLQVAFLIPYRIKGRTLSISAIQDPPQYTHLITALSPSFVFLTAHKAKNDVLRFQKACISLDPLGNLEPIQKVFGFRCMVICGSDKTENGTRLQDI